MNRRNFIQIVGASFPALALSPSDALPLSTAEPPAANNPQRLFQSHFPHATLCRVLQLAREYPGEQLVAICRRPSLCVIHSRISAQRLLLENPAPEKLAAYVGIPKCLRRAGVIPDLQLSGVTSGSNASARSTGGKVVRFVESRYVSLRFLLPDGTRFVFNIGTRQNGNHEDSPDREDAWCVTLDGPLAQRSLDAKAAGAFNPCGWPT